MIWYIDHLVSHAAQEYRSAREIRVGTHEEAPEGARFGATAVERPTVLVISEEQEFVRAISNRWQAQRNSPRLVINSANAENVALIIVGSAQVPEAMQASGIPVIHVSRES